MISVICPVYNESKYIKQVLDFCVNAYPAEKEIIFIDGHSTDDTCEIIDTYRKQHANIRLLHNPLRIVPYSLNLALKEAKGEIVIRLDAHTIYSSDYFEKIIEVFGKSGADIVGGPMRIAKGNEMQEAIGYATSTFFGIGDSSFHFEDFEGFTDSVYLGAWKKTIFSVTGVFDESLKRNQDDEFHYRAKKHGFRIYQSPSIRLQYYPRETISALFKQYFEYGLYKPTVLKKNQAAIQLRHLIPSIFVIYLALSVIFLFLKYYSLLIPLCIYLLADIFYTLSSKKRLSVILRIFICYPILHIAYGSGFIAGLTKLLSRKQNTPVLLGQ